MIVSLQVEGESARTHGEPERSSNSVHPICRGQERSAPVLLRRCGSRVEAVQVASGLEGTRAGQRELSAACAEPPLDPDAQIRGSSKAAFAKRTEGRTHLGRKMRPVASGEMGPCGRACALGRAAVGGRSPCSRVWVKVKARGGEGRCAGILRQFKRPWCPLAQQQQRSPKVGLGASTHCPLPNAHQLPPATPTNDSHLRSSPLPAAGRSDDPSLLLSSPLCTAVVVMSGSAYISEYELQCSATQPWQLVTLRLAARASSVLEPRCQRPHTLFPPRTRSSAGS